MWILRRLRSTTEPHGRLQHATLSFVFASLHRDDRARARRGNNIHRSYHPMWADNRRPDVYDDLAHIYKGRSGPLCSGDRARMCLIISIDPGHASPVGYDPAVRWCHYAQDIHSRRGNGRLGLSRRLLQFPPLPTALTIRQCLSHDLH